MAGETVKAACRIGVDIGGTFTDIVFLGADGELRTKKLPSTPDNYARGIGDGIRAVLAEGVISGGQVSEVIHGTTVASNAILEHRGAKTGLLTTAGFRDVLEIGRLRMPRLYDIAWEKPVPLVPRYLRREVAERVDHRGRIVRPLDRKQAQRQIAAPVADGVEAIAICLLNSYTNPDHERQLADLVREVAPHLPLSVSCNVLPEIREYERTSTTVVNAYVMPVVERYLRVLREELAASGVTAPLLIMQSSGGVMGAATAMTKPMHIIESGPAAGVVGAGELARRLGLENVITFDMGGTTAKASIIEAGTPSRAGEMEVGAGMSVGTRLMKGGGYLVRMSAVDIAEVGAGGGSVVWLDRGRVLHVGPRSAGAVPGPACYGVGTEPTVTDANVILGCLNPEGLAGGAVRLDAERAARAFHERVAGPTGLDLAAAAAGAQSIVNANMIRAVKAVSSERGRDPREYVLFAFGGNGPLHGVEIARALEMRTVIVPPAPGLFSALGLLLSEVEHHYVRSYIRRTSAVEPAELEDVVLALVREAEASLVAEGYAPDELALAWSADLRYAGQASELTVPMVNGKLAGGGLEELARAFEQEHERTYGHRATDEPVELVNLRLTACVRRPDAWVSERVAVDRRGRTARGMRRVYFGAHGWLDTPVIDRGDLRGGGGEGPLVVEEYDATAVVPPGCRAWLDELGNIVIELGA